MQSQQQMRTNTLPKLNRNILTMPKWVNEAHDRIGPKPPAPPPSPGNSSIGGKPPALPPKTSHQPEPDYEVIEFSGQQYSNEPMIKNNSGLRSKTPDAKLKCTLCGSNNPWVTCDECAKQIFCASCDDMFHKHPKRKSHVRKAIEQNLPPIPPKASADQPGPTPPVAPPRRSKRGFPTPLLQRKNQVTNNSAAIPPPSPTPSMRSSTWHDRVDSLKRGMSLSNRPLPDTPKTPTDEMSSRSTTPKSVFDTIQRPPSVTLEKIKSKASATLDRMAVLQQRYRQQKEVQEHNRSNSVVDQNFPFDQWSNISPTPSHFRSGSMSSGLNSSHFDLSDDTHFNLSSRQRQTQQQQMIANRNCNLGARNMSTSVFNLSQPNRKSLENHSNWMNTQMQQAQSVAHLNCTSCNHPNRAWPPSPHQHQQQQQPVRHPDDWNNQFSSNQQLNRSNLSLNMQAMYMMPQHHPLGMYPPPVFMNQLNQQRGIPQNMYPYPYPGMPVMNTGIVAMPPTARSRATSRANSRLPSPTLSRKSLSLRKKHSNYQETDPTDDEDSDQDDRRSLISNRSGIAGTPRARQRRVSSVSQAFLDDDSESTNPRNLRSKIRDQRRGSAAKSVQSDWTPGKHNVQPNESDFGLPSKPSKIYSDLDSESSGTRALVQAKIQQKLEEAPKQYSNVNEAVETTSSKRSTEIQADTVKNKNEGNNEKPDNYKMLAKVIVGGNQNNSEEEEEAEDEEEEKVDEVHENKEENAYKTDEEDGSPPLGPPPSTPDHEWECEFCTFVNEPKVKICSICCKTPSKPPTAPKKQPPQIQMKSTVTLKSTTSTLAAPKTKTTVMKTTEKKQISNGIASTSKQSQSEDDSEATITKKKVQKKTKNSVDSVEDIWAALDENIQATAGEVIRNAKSKISQKVSTGCGPSPPREIQANKAANIKKVSKEIGTSPPPQTISTQTYDTLPLLNIDTNKEQSIIPLDNKTVIQTEYIDASNFKSPNIAELNATDTRSVASPDSNLSLYRDVSTFHNDRDRYRSSNDLHQSEASPIDFSPLPPITGLGRRQSSVAELLGLQRAQSQMHTPYNLQSFPCEQSYFEYKPARNPEMELYLLIKEAELYKFTSEELHVALKHCSSDVHPVQWLRENWPKLIQTVQSLATKYGQERAENTIGTISQSEAREALCIHFGNIWQAVSECIEQRQRKYREISNKGNYSREDIVTALTTQHGNVESALMDLSKIQLKPFLMRIWGSPGGIENESGTNLATSPSPTTQSMTDFDLIKSDIHDFLNANVLECAQTPALAASHIKDFSFQTHSSPNDRDHYRQTDNLTNYSHDSKENTVSPFQLEESPLHNKTMLKDLETLIGNMEQNQAKQNEEVLRNIEGMFSNLMTKKELEPSDFGEERIFMKSPINTPRMKPSEQNEAVGKPYDVKNFVWQHIQEIVPDLVQQVEKELMERDEKYPEENNTPLSHIAQETVPIQSDEMIMKILINPNMKYSTIREEIPPHFTYAAEIANFRMEFDRAQDSEQEAFFDAFSLEEAPRKFYKMFLAQKNANASKNPQTNSYLNDKNQLIPNSNISNDFQDLNNAITENFPSQMSFQEKELQSEPKKTAFLDINQIESNEIGAQALFTEKIHEEDSIQDQSSLRNSESLQSLNSTIEKATKNILEVPKLLPLERNIIQKSQKEVEKSSVIFTDSTQTQIEEFEMASENNETSLSTEVSINVHPQSEEITPSAIADEKQNVTQKPSDKKSQLPRQKKKTTVDRPKTIDNNSLKITSLQSEITSDPFTYDLEDNLEPTVSAEITTTLDDSASEFITNEVTSDMDVTNRSFLTQSEDIIINQKDIGCKETDEPKKIQIINSKTQHAAESAVGETATIETNEESNDSNTTNRKSRRSVKLSKIPIRSNTNINNYNNQNVKASEKITVNSNKIINMSLDQMKDNQVSELEPAYVNSNTSIENQKSSTTRDVAVVNSKEVVLNLAMEDENNTTEEHADTENDENNSENHDVFQDVAEHSSDDENEENNINSIDAKVEVASQDDEHEGTSDEELFSLHSNNTAADEEHFNKSEENQETEHNQLETNMSKQAADFQSTNSVMKQNGYTTLKDFVPSSDPSKQNLSELVMDTKRLIKQMKDEITMVELESSEDESMDSYSDEYENYSGETDDWDDEQGEEEEVESDFNEDDEDEYLEGNKDEVGANADEIEDDYTETHYENEDGEEAQGNDIKSDVMNTNNPDINIAIRSISKSLKDDNALSSDLEIEDIEHDDLKEESHELQNQNQGDSEALIATRFNNMHSLSFGASSSITNTSAPLQTASSEIETSIQVEIPFIAETPKLTDVDSLAQHIDSTVILNEELTGTQDNQPTRFLAHTTVQGTSLPLTVIQSSEPANVRSNKQENSLTAQDETISTNLNTTTVTTEFQSLPPGNTDTQSEAQTLLPENTESNAHISDEETPTTSKVQEDKQAITESDGAIAKNSSSLTEAVEIKAQSRTNQTSSAKNLNTIVVIPQKMPKEKSNISKIPKPKDFKKSNIKSKVLLRSKSFSGPPTPIGISSVKAIQQEFLNRQTQLTMTHTIQLNPPPTVFRKKSITETISKLTKPFDSLDGPSTSAAAASLFRKRTQPRIPKKKYHETCFSDDDYQTSSSEAEPEPLIVLQRKQSVPVFRTYPSVQEPEAINTETLAQNLIEEKLVESFAEAQIAAALINMKFQKDVSVWAAKECSDLDQAIGLLQQECELCMGTFSLNQMVSMLKCTHKCCKECAKTYFTVQITDRSINDCNCPFCKIPELHGQNQHEDENLEYFSNLDIFLKSILEAEVHELFQRKLRDRTLLQDPNFKWCVQCSSGFFVRPKQKRLICPDCGSVTCSQCRKIWEKQHEGISCEKYLEWKENNDPEIQAQGVQQHLALHGIDCPKCKFRYSLARGGCMHFTCTQCKFEFCYGCAKPFMMGAKCSVSPYCAKLGLHAHHPRNCLFYLRDKIPLQLQFLLKENGVSFDVDPMITKNEDSTHTPGRCPVPLQKETPKGLVDTICNGDVSDKHGGLCRTHYVEYLSAKVAKARIDPLPIFDLTDCVQELRRRGLPLPERGPWDTDEIYKGMCTEIIKQKIPLETD